MQRQGQQLMPSLSARKLIFLWKQKEFPYLGFAFINIIKIFNKYKFKGWYLERILHEKRDFLGGNRVSD